MFLEESQQARLSASDTKKRKCVVDEIHKLKTKRQRLENDTCELNKCADDFCLNAHYATVCQAEMQ